MVEFNDGPPWVTEADFAPPPLPPPDPLMRLRQRLRAARRDTEELRCVISYLAGRYPDTFPQQFREAAKALDELGEDQ